MESKTEVSIRVPLTIEGNLPARDAISNLPRMEAVQVTLEGDKAKGVVHHFAHHHLSQSGNDRDFCIEGGQRNAAIIRELGVLGVSDCFLEGISVGDNLTWLAEGSRDYDELRAEFPSRQISLSLSDEQAVILANASWPRVIHFFFPDLRIHGTEPEDGRIVKHGNFPKDPATREAIVHHYREVIALDSIMDIFGRKPVESRTAALIYGASHNFTPKNIPIPYSRTDAPLVIKYNFEYWSMTRTTTIIMAASNEAEQLAAIDKATRIHEYAWSKALSGKVQLAMIAKLKANPDSIGSPEALLHDLLVRVKDGPIKSQVESALRTAIETRQGPFADLTLRPNSESDIERAKGEFPSLCVYDELHPFTQLEMIKHSKRLESYCFGRIISEKGQLEALRKLIPSPRVTLDQLKTDLLSSCVSRTVHSEVLRRFATGETPFNAEPTVV